MQRALGACTARPTADDAGPVPAPRGDWTARRRYAAGAEASATLQQISDKLSATGDTSSLAKFFAGCDAEAVLLHTGPLKRFQGQSRAGSLAAAFSELAADTATPLDACTNLVASLTLLGDFDVPLIHAAVCRVVPELPSMAPARIAAMCYSLGTAGYSNHAFLKALERTMLSRAAEFDVIALSKVVWMLGRVHYINEAVGSLVDTLVQRALDPGATPREVLYAMWASGAHDDRNDALVDRTLATLPPHVPDLSGAELAKLAWGLVQQRVGVTDIFESIARASVAALDDMHPRDIAKLSWAMGQVDAGADVLPRALSEHVRRHLEFFSRNELDMILSAYNSWGVHDATVNLIADQMGKTQS